MTRININSTSNGLTGGRIIPSRTIVSHHQIRFVTFEIPKEELVDSLFYNLIAFHAFGQGKEQSVISSIRIDPAKLAVAVGLSKNIMEAKLLIKNKKLCIGEPVDGKKLKPVSRWWNIKIKDPLNSMITLSRNSNKWSFIIFEK